LFEIWSFPSEIAEPVPSISEEARASQRQAGVEIASALVRLAKAKGGVSLRAKRGNLRERYPESECEGQKGGGSECEGQKGGGFYMLPPYLISVSLTTLISG